jgi:hypothetical protein
MESEVFYPGFLQESGKAPREMPYIHVANIPLFPYLIGYYPWQLYVSV